MQKKKVTAFEYVFMEAAHRYNPNTIDIEKYEPYTRAEELQQRKDNIKQQLAKILISYRPDLLSKQLIKRLAAEAIITVSLTS